MGDVWRLLPALQKFRPDLRILLLDCPPSGLVACTNLDPASAILEDNFDAILAEFGTMSLSDYGVENLWGLYPVVDTARLQSDPVAMRMLWAQVYGGDATARGVMSSRVGEGAGRAVTPQSGLLSALGRAEGVQARLTGFFCQPIPVRLHQPVEAYRALTPGVHIGFQNGAEVQLTVEPKIDHSLSPESCLNTVRLSYTGASPFLTLEAYCSWSDFSGAQRYQLGVYAVPDRTVSCHAILRLPRKGGGFLDQEFSAFNLRPDERACNPSGLLLLPEDLEVDRKRDPQLLIFFDTSRDLEIQLDYINLYFA